MNAIIEIDKNEIQDSRVNMEALFTRWIAYLDATPKTVSTYRNAVKQFVLWLDGKGITEPVRADIITYRDELKENHKPATVQLYIGAVKLFFRWLEQENIYKNVAEHVKGAKVDTEHKKDPLTSNQVTKLMGSIDTSTLKGKRDYAILLLMVTTGLRTISVSCANICDMRPVGDSMGLYYKGKGHEEKAAAIKMSPFVEDAIRDYLNTRGATSSDEPLFASIAHRNGGERMTTRSISRIVKEHFKEVGLISDRLTAHSLRHTAATTYISYTGNIRQAQQMLNHSNINTTLIYEHSLNRANNDAELVISKILFGA